MGTEGWGPTKMRSESGRGLRGGEAKAGGGEGGRWGGAASVTASLAAGSAHRSWGPRSPLASSRLPSPSVPVPTCSALRPEPGSSSGRSERSSAPHPPAAPSQPQAFAAAAAPALKRTNGTEKGCVQKIK